MSKNIRHHIIVANKFPITKTFRKIPENLGCQFLTLIWFLNICYHNIVNIDHKYLGRDTKDEYLANSNNSLAKKGQPPLGGASWEHLDYHFSFYVYIFHYPCVALVEKTWIIISHFPMCGLNCNAGVVIISKNNIYYNNIIFIIIIIIILLFYNYILIIIY